MKKGKIKQVIKNNIFGFILGVLITSTVAVSAATYYASKDVSYDNASSGMSSDNVQDAIDELYDLANPKNLSDVLSVTAKDDFCNSYQINLNYNGSEDIPLEIKIYNSNSLSTDISEATLSATNYYTTADKTIKIPFTLGKYTFTVISSANNKYNGSITTQSIYHSSAPDRC